ncbi:MAG: MurT ligase domain-containing protein [Bifidobacteriaceae bacterium]|jgi:UDP-N-acetylmuramyl tripeptide synthase|nr:MurT ligase domain-containing protein [Bifidobacteriaceae bacterium]
MQILAEFIGKTVVFFCKLFHFGGSAFPGLVVEKICPTYLQRVLSDLPYGVLVVTGTNGKTTTSKIVTELLQDYGLRVFTNKTGSNFSRGVISEYLSSGTKSFDIAVLELDEAHGIKLVEKVAPNYLLLLNVFRDQLDRFGEINYTAKLLEKFAKITTENGGVVVINSNDPLITEFSDLHFGFSDNMQSFFPDDSSLHSDSKTNSNSNSKTQNIFQLQNYKNSIATFEYQSNSYNAKLQLLGAHNALNSAAALSIVSKILDSKFDAQKSIKTLEMIKPAFGRGEKITINDSEIYLNLVKNPAGFNSSLKTIASKNSKVIYIINDDYADGRDVSWLWDVDYSNILNVEAVSGKRAYDLALKLKSQNIQINNIDESIQNIVDQIVSNKQPDNYQIFCTYTALLKTRALLSKHTDVEHIL